MSELVQILWDSLLDLDDLSASTNSIMELLSTILSQDTPTTGHAPLLRPDNLTTLVPRLWPFLSHLIISVRLSSLKALHTILNYSGYTPPLTDGVDNELAGVKGHEWLRDMLGSMLHQVLQRLVLEGNERARELAHQVGIAVCGLIRCQEIVYVYSWRLVLLLFFVTSMVYVVMVTIPSSSPLYVCKKALSICTTVIFACLYLSLL